jgi:hypothetical protein
VAQFDDSEFTHVFKDGDKYLNSDAVFGVKDELVATIEHHREPVMPDGEPTMARDAVRFQNESGRRRGSATADARCGIARLDKRDTNGRQD